MSSRPILLSYRTLGLGDLLTAVPALRALRAAHPEHEHVLAAPSWLAPLTGLVEAVDRQLAVDELATPSLAAGWVDVAVNLHGAGPQSHRALAALGPRRLIAHHHPQYPGAAGSPPWRAEDHEVVRWCRLLQAHGIPADPSDLRITPPLEPAPPATHGVTVVHPGAKAAARRWPPERFAAVARHEVRAGRQVVVTGSPDEITLARRVAAAAGLTERAVLAGRLDLLGLVAVLAAAGRLVCGDTGVAHLATALGTPSVVLFGPTSPERWGPPPQLKDRHRALWAGAHGDPLAATPDAGLLRLGVEDVLAELRTLDAVRTGGLARAGGTPT